MSKNGGASSKKRPTLDKVLRKLPIKRRGKQHGLFADASSDSSDSQSEMTCRSIDAPRSQGMEESPWSNLSLKNSHRSPEDGKERAQEETCMMVFTATGSTTAKRKQECIGLSSIHESLRGGFPKEEVDRVRRRWTRINTMFCATKGKSKGRRKI